jgi:hypothetical protein
MKMTLTSNSRSPTRLTTKLGLTTALTVFWIVAVAASPALAQRAPTWSEQSHHGVCGDNYGRYCADSN